MKKIEKYVCEICHTEFDYEAPAETCEQMHTYPLKGKPELIYTSGCCEPEYIKIRCFDRDIFYKKLMDCPSGLMRKKGVPILWEENQ